MNSPVIKKPRGSTVGAALGAIPGMKKPPVTGAGVLGAVQRKIGAEMTDHAAVFVKGAGLVGSVANAGDKLVGAGYGMVKKNPSGIKNVVGRGIMRAGTFVGDHPKATLGIAGAGVAGGGALAMRKKKEAQLKDHAGELVKKAGVIDAVSRFGAGLASRGGAAVVGGAGPGAMNAVRRGVGGATHAAGSFIKNNPKTSLGIGAGAAIGGGALMMRKKESAFFEGGRKTQAAMARHGGNFADEMKDIHAQHPWTAPSGTPAKIMARRHAYNSEQKGMSNLKLLNPFAGMGSKGQAALDRVRGKAASAREGMLEEGSMSSALEELVAEGGISPFARRCGDAAALALLGD